MSDTIKATLVERGARYGSFFEGAQVSRQLRETILEAVDGRGGQLMPDQIEAIFMICHKLSRIATGDPHYHDSWTDIAGYAELVAARLRPLEEPKQTPGPQPVKPAKPKNNLEF